MIIYERLDRAEETVAILLALWETSVKQSHDFLDEAARDRLVPFVKLAIEQVETLLLAERSAEIVGFMGIEGKKIEMLFISSACFRQGVGRQMIAFARQRHQIRFVDVNEQNPGAYAFYKRMGFDVYERSPFDEQGNAFPILKMRLPENIK